MASSPSSRFATPVSGFDPDEIVRRLRRTFGVCVAAAVAIHALTFSVDLFESRRESTARPTTTRFMKRTPRLTKPLELRKIPRPKRRIERRELRMAQARMDQVQATAHFSTRRLVAAQGVGMSVAVGDGELSDARLEPVMLRGAITSTRTSEHRVDMALEMLDVNSMDTGRYRALVVQDEGDRQAVTGFVKFARVVSSSATGIAHDDPRTGSRTIDRLCDAINEYTGVQADFVGLLTYDDPRLLEVPIILPQGNPNETEMRNLVDYVLAGGFVFGDVRRGQNEELVYPPIEGWDDGLEKYGGLVRGKDFWAERLPSTHPVFSAYFDVGGGAPLGNSAHNTKQGSHWWSYVNGFFVNGRLAGIMPNRTSWGWNNDIMGTIGGIHVRRLQLAVNIVIYALTQEGSITQRLMQMVN
jgi:hypothetical protein